jgi:multiple RNA-binding domain-containing protein 1
LMRPEDIVTGRTAGLSSRNVEPVTETSASVDQHVSSNDKPAEETLEEEGEENPDPTIEAIKSNGRLFVRNLPYSASEDDLRRHFEPFGPLEEVRISPFSLVISVHFMMNIQIGTAYASSM